MARGDPAVRHVPGGSCPALGADWERRLAGMCGQTRSDTVIVPRMNVSDVLDAVVQRTCRPERSVRDEEAAGSNPATPTEVKADPWGQTT